MSRLLPLVVALALSACTPTEDVEPRRFDAHFAAKQVADYTRSTVAIIRKIAEKRSTPATVGQPLTAKEQQLLRGIYLPFLDFARKSGKVMALQLEQAPGADSAAYQGCKAAIASTLDLIEQARHVVETGARADAMIPAVDRTDALIKSCGEGVARTEPTIDAHLDGIRERLRAAPGSQ